MATCFMSVYVYVCSVCAFVCVSMHVPVHTWRPEVDVMGLALSLCI